MSNRACKSAVALLGMASLGLCVAAPASARQAVACEGVVEAGAAQMVCSHLDPKKPPQFCTYKWQLTNAANMPQMVQGSFTLPPESSNVQIYEGSGFSLAVSPPIVMCFGRRGAP